MVSRKHGPVFALVRLCLKGLLCVNRVCPELQKTRPGSFGNPLTPRGTLPGLPPQASCVGCSVLGDQGSRDGGLARRGFWATCVCCKKTAHQHFPSFVFFWSGHTEFECNKTRVALESCTAGNKNCTAVFVSCSAVFCCKPPSEHDFLYICVKYIPQTGVAAKNCTAGTKKLQCSFCFLQCSI